MSLNDITLNGLVYTLTSIQGSKVIRAVQDMSGVSQPPYGSPITMEIAHTIGSGKSPDRRMIKFVVPTTPQNATEIVPNSPVSLHIVATIPKGLDPNDVQPLFVSTSGPTLTDALVTLVQSGTNTYDFMKSFLLGGFG